MSAKKSFPYHPFLFAISPLLHLYAQNTSQVLVSQVLTALLPLLLLSSAVYLGATLLASKDPQRAALMTLSFLFFFLFYGTIRSGIQLVTTRWVFPSSDRRYFLPAWCVLVLAYSAYFLKTERKLLHANRFLNTTSLILVGMSAANLLVSGIQNGFASRQTEAAIARSSSITASTDSDHPDIYYIILDGYGRADTLQRLYEFDNTPFLSEIESLGFRVANASRANYCQTHLSLASSLNLEHITSLLDLGSQPVPTTESLLVLIRNSKVVDELHKEGYTFIAFETGYYATEIAGADLYWRPPASPLVIGDAFTSAVVHMTPLSALLYEGRMTAYDTHRERVLFTFDKLTAVVEIPGPKFVLAHVVSPHPPFVFDRDGSPLTPDYPYSLNDGSHLIGPGGITREEFLHGYVNQLAFVNQRILETISAIISGSSRPPVIILQADHGPGSLLDNHSAEDTFVGERLAILNAYYLPEIDASKVIWNDITPVNSFRVILNHYFGTTYEMLPDRSFYSPWDRAFDLVDVTDRVLAETAWE